MAACVHAYFFYFSRIYWPFQSKTDTKTTILSVRSLSRTQIELRPYRVFCCCAIRPEDAPSYLMKKIPVWKHSFTKQAAKLKAKSISSAIFTPLYKSLPATCCPVGIDIWQDVSVQISCEEVTISLITYTPQKLPLLCTIAQHELPVCAQTQRGGAFDCGWMCMSWHLPISVNGAKHSRKKKKKIMNWHTGVNSMCWRDVRIQFHAFAHLSYIDALLANLGQVSRMCCAAVPHTIRVWKAHSQPSGGRAEPGNTGCDGPLLSSEAEAVEPVGAVVCRRHLSDRLFSLLLLILDVLLDV